MEYLSLDPTLLKAAATNALLAAATLFVSHATFCSIVIYFDFSGRWTKYALNKSRSSDIGDRVRDYWNGWTKFCLDLVLLFIPFMTCCFYYQHETILQCQDSWSVTLFKLGAGYVLGKIWAFVVHYALHHPSVYWIHRRHHRNPKNLVASAAWDDSYIEYAIMELPSFAITLLLFPTHLYVHLVHFAWHGYDGAAGHSGFKAPGLLGALFDGEYHYHHHSILQVNYAEIELLDKIAGTHHSQRARPAHTKPQ